MSSTRIDFINTLFEVGNSKKYSSNSERYQEMGKRCKLTDYLNGGAPYYIFDETNKPNLFDDSIKDAFIALNVEAPATEIGSSPIIPFFSIKVDGVVDSKELRDDVMNIAKNAAKDEFLTCPEYVNGHNGLEKNIKIDKILFEVEIGHNGIISVSISDKISAFDETETDELKNNIESLTSFLLQYKEKSFLYSWCKPFFNGDDKKLLCNVRAVDRDKDATSHSIFVTIFNEDKTLRKWLSYYGEDVMNIIAIVKSIFIGDIQKKQLSESVKSAKAAIMSRNMSHNLGSHVMSYLKHHLSTVKDMLNDKILSQLIENADELENFILKSGWKQNPGDVISVTKVKNGIELQCNENSDNKELQNNSDDNTPDNGGIRSDEEIKTIKESEVDKVALPFLVGLGQFISYLQERQDFIATIATDYVPYYSNVNFKDFIYDELNNDKRYERHPDRQNLKSDNILLGNIARSEGLGRPTRPTDIEGKKSLSDIVLKFRTTFTGDPVESISPAKGKPGVEPLNYYKDKNAVAIACAELEEMRDYDVSLPGGIVGRQAIFSIFENVIRNAAKHGNWREKGKLELTIDIFSKQDVLTPDENTKKRLTIDNWDDESLTLQEVLIKFYCHNSEDNLYFVTLTDNLSFSEANLISLRKALIEDYIDNQGLMINSNKGIKEMRISSAWLRSIEDNPKESIVQPKIGDKKWDNSKQSVPPILYARISKDENGVGHLQYIFCLLRPQVVAFVSSKIEVIEDAYIKTSLQKKFWSVFTPDSYLDCKNKSFSFVIYDDTTDKELEDVNGKEMYKKIRRSSSPRVLKLSDMGNNDVDNIVLRIRNIILEGKTNSDYNSLSNLMDSAVTSLYCHLSKWDSSEMIYINDVKAKNKYNEDLAKNKVMRSDDKITFNKDETKARYRYVTHLEGKNEFKYYVVDNEPKDNRLFVFSEGITGNNSTDRLVRNESLTDNWFFKHLYAMKQKVAILDERIFSKAYGVEESSFIISKITNYGNIGDTDEKRFENDKEMLKTVYSELDEEISDCHNRLELNELLSDLEYNPHTGKDIDSVDAESHLGATFAEKNIYIFSIIRSVENTKEPVFYLYGYHYDKSKPNFSQCVRFAKITWENNRLNFTPCDNAKNITLTDFDFFSIHQGLLDKLYDAFGIKESVRSTQEKEELTRDLYKEFIARGDIFEFVDEKEEDKIKHYFLPGMTIHSGRSKPSKNDMPQHLPFVPFSAIEHAVLDCKFSLIELLNSARYE